MIKPNGIPIKNYFDPEIYAKEKDLLFKRRPIYLGAKGMLQKDGDYRVVERVNDSKILTLKNDQISLVDNICSHRQAKMMSGTGNSKYLSCPYHRWSYEHDTGKCVNSPFCKNEKVDASLNRSKINHWKNLLFNGEGDFGNDVSSFKL